MSSFDSTAMDKTTKNDVSGRARGMGMAAEIPEVDPLDTGTLHNARRTVAAWSADAQECALLWKMLGIHPSQDGEHAHTTTTGIPRPPNARSVGGLRWE